MQKNVNTIKNSPATANTGCACAGDPTVDGKQTEQCIVLIRVNKKTAKASFTPLAD